MTVVGDQIIIVETGSSRILKISPVATAVPAAKTIQAVQAPATVVTIPWPVDGYSSIAACYGEVRPKGAEPRDHFHEGIDFVGLNNSSTIRAVDNLRFRFEGSMSVTFRSLTNPGVQWRYVHVHSVCVAGQKCILTPIKYWANITKYEDSEFALNEALPIKIFELGHTHLTKYVNGKKVNYGNEVGWSDSVPPTLNRLGNGAEIGILRKGAHRLPPTSSTSYFYPYDAASNTYTLVGGDSFEIIVNAYDQVDPANNAGTHKLGVTKITALVQRPTGIVKYQNGNIDFTNNAEIGEVKSVFANGSYQSKFLYHLNYWTGDSSDSVSTAGWDGEYEVQVVLTGTRGETTVKVVKLKIVCGGTVMWKGKEWQQCGSDYLMHWDQAVTYCSDLTDGGHTDWVLPTIEDLRGLIVCSNGTNVTYGPGAPQYGTSGHYNGYLFVYDLLNPISCADGNSVSYNYPTISSIFNAGSGSYSWSSTSYANYTGDAWEVNFHDGEVSHAIKTYSLYARCVRGGP